MSGANSLLHYSTTPTLQSLSPPAAMQQGNDPLQRRRSGRSSRERKLWVTYNGLSIWGRTPPARIDAIEKARDYIEAQLRHSGWQVTRQAFTDDTPRGKIHFAIARFRGRHEFDVVLIIVVLALRSEIIRHHPFCGSERHKHRYAVGDSPRAGQHPSLARKVELTFRWRRGLRKFCIRMVFTGAAPRQLQGEGAKQYRGGILFDMHFSRSLGITLPEFTIGDGTRCFCRGQTESCKNRRSTGI